MPRSRTPQAKAEASGATVINPGRFEGRKGPKRTRPLGEPYVAMTEAQKTAWAEFQTELPWLHSGHRTLVRMACVYVARMDEGELGVQAMNSLSSILSKLGATPADETKVNHADGDDESPEDKFFGRPN